MDMLSYFDVLNNLDVEVVVFDCKGNYEFVNTALVNKRNIPRAKLMKMNVHDFLKVLDFSVFDLVMEKKRRVSRVQYYRDIHQMNREPRLRLTIGVPLFDENGNIQHVVNMMQDIQDFEEICQTSMRENKVMVFEQDELLAAEAPRIIAKSPAFLRLLELARNVAPLDSTVLLCGESGCGKEVLADYIYRHSERREKPMITVNCAAFPESLIEAELFGYERGAFTGASREGKPGLVSTADGGTLFLDEINSLPLNVQGKLLRTLEDKSIQRIGSTKTKKVDFRLIVATNRNLREMVSEGEFREDLYYRLQVIPLTIPPIRERREDIIPLCLHFLQHFCMKYDVRKELSETVLKELEHYEWPGNVREIRNFAERVAVMTPKAAQEIHSISPGLLDFGGKAENVAKPREPENFGVPAGFEMQASSGLGREQIIAALAECGQHRGKAAKLLGISVRKLQYKIKEYHLSTRCRYKEDAEGGNV
ncbi:MAG: sigma 54-interacting transcriptional regulator [Lachnospiraceae bacterium]|nr:sigma 54-interacting transcriptional regulator [Lachnospiraceae bacterium]